MCSESAYWMKKRGSKCMPAQHCALMEHLLYARAGAATSFDLIATLRGRSSYYPHFPDEETEDHRG